MITEKEAAKLEGLHGSLSAHFKDFFLVVRTENGLSWRSSDVTWSRAAIQEYMDSMAFSQHMHRLNHINKGGPD